MSIPTIENYPVSFDHANALLRRIGDDAYIEPMLMVIFAKDSHAVAYFLRFEDVIHRYNDRIWTVPKGYGAEQWLSEYSPESKIDEDWVWILFKSENCKRAFEAALIPEAGPELLAHLERPLCL